MPALRRRSGRVVVTGSVSALVAGLLYGAVAPAASADDQVAPAAGEVAGIETVGPIATVAAASGQRWPSLPPSVAVMPSGSVLSGEFPLVRVPALESVESIDFRVVDLRSDRRLVEFEGTLESGWATVGASLPAGGLYDVEVASDGGWSRVGSFSVAVEGTEPGPPLSVGGISVSSVTGLTSTGWTSRPLVGPVSSAGVALSWAGGVASTPGLPEGWRLTVASGSPWSGLFEDGQRVEAVDVPGKAVAVRSKPRPKSPVASERAKRVRATVSFAYPERELAEVDGFVVQTKEGRGRWKTQRSAGVSFAQTNVNARVSVPARGVVRVRVGVVADGVTVWGPASRVFNAGRQPAQGVRPTTSGDLPGAGPNSVVTAGEMPDVVTIEGWDGSRLSFVRNALGVYEQTGGTPGFRNSLTRESASVWEFTDTQGVVTRFESGRAVSVTMDGKVMSRIAWDGSGRVASVTNEIGRTMTLKWQGQGECASDSWTQYGFAAVPEGYLCAIEYPYGESELIGYVTAGEGAQIALIKSPGNEGVTWGWDTQGRVVSTRTALVSQVATIEPASAGVIASVSYDDQGRAFRLTDQPAVVGGSSLSSVIDFPAVSEADLRAWSASPGTATAVAGRVSVAGLPGVSNFQTTLFDPVSWQPLQVTGSEGAQIAKLLTANGGVQGMRDAIGRVTRSQTNELGLVTRSEGPSTGAGMVVERDYDTEFVNGEDRALVGLRAQVYPRAGFSGNPTPVFWRADAKRGGLSAAWSGQSSSSSVQAAGVWTPDERADQAGSQRGWQLEVSSSAGAQVTVLVGGQPCTDRSCVITGVPTGPKAVTVQVDDAGADGWFSVDVAPVGQAPAPVASDEVAPGYALGTFVKNNDDLPGGPTGSITRYAFADPASGRVTSVTSSGGQTGRVTYETTGWKRAVSTTTAGGGTKRITYWGDNETASLPGVCGGGSFVQSGLTKSTTRQDGSAVVNYFDERGQLRASVVTDTTGATAQTACMTYTADGTVATEAIYDSSGALIESAQTTVAVGGDPRTAMVTITQGPAAPVTPGDTVSESTTVDLAGRVVSSTDITGVVAAAVYDNTGALTRMTITPPAGSGQAPLVFDYTYRANDGLLLTTRVNGVLAASYTYDGVTTRIAAVDYADGVRAAFGYGPDGRADTMTVTSPNEAFTRITQNRSTTAFGRIESEILTVTGTAARREARGYSFDAAGRLTKAIINTESDDAGVAARRVFDYAFATTQPASCGGGYAKPGLDNLRTGGARDGVAFTQCYDTAGRLVSTTDPYVTGGADTASQVTYDALGRVDTISGPRAAALTWAAGTQVASISEIATDGADLVRTTMDVFGGQLVDKTLTTNTGSSTLRYAGPFLLDITEGAITGTRAISYGIGVGGRVTTAPGATATLSLPGLDGAALVTLEVPSLGRGAAAAPGEPVGLADRYGPYGEPLIAPNPGDANVMPDYGWAAGAGMETLPGTSAITIMGARPYSPYLGVFLAPDPVVDSGTNLYSYTLGDPINTRDTSGRMTDEELGGIIAGAGVAAAILGGFIAGRFGTSLKRAIVLNANTPAQAARYSWGAARTVDALGGLAAVAGIGAAGYGTYIAVKSATDSAAAAAGAAAGAVLLSAYGGYAGFVTGALTTGLKKILKAKALDEKWSVGQYYNPVKAIRKVRGAGQETTAARAANDNFSVTDLNDLLAAPSQRSSEQLLVRSQVSVKSEKLVVAPKQNNLSQRTNSYQRESSSTEGVLEQLMQKSDRSSETTWVDPTAQFMLKQLKFD